MSPETSHETSTEIKTPIAEIVLEALDYRVDEDGTEWLKGYRLAPDNDELWHPQKFNITSEEWYWDEDELVGIRKETRQFTSKLTNARVRQANINCIIRVGMPVFITEEEAWSEIHGSWKERYERYNNTRRGRFLIALGFRKPEWDGRQVV